MKGKFRLMWRIGLALVLALSLSLVMAVPVSAAVSQPTVTVDPPLAGEVAEYTIGFDINTSLATGGTITVVFHGGTTVPTTYAAGDITVQGADVSASGSDTTVVIVLANAISAPAAVEVIFTTAAGIENPSVGDKNLTVKTSAEDVPVISETYTILALPAVTNIEPDEGNVGDTMWVEVSDINNNFTGDIDTNESTTTLDFGGGITVGSTKFIGTGEIDVQITITAPGTVQVAATTAAGTGTGTYTFTANPADTAQVDVWLQYTPDTDTIFDTDTLEPKSDPMSYDTIVLGIGAATSDDVLIVHADTYVEQVVIGTSITLESLSGADSTIIYGSAVTNDGVVRVTATGVIIDGFTIKGNKTATWCQGIVIWGDQFTVKNNKFIDVPADNILVLPPVEVTDGLIDDNTITGLGSDALRAGILVESGGYAIAGVTISNNTISDMGGVWPAIQVSEVSGEVSNIAITGNTISNGTTGIKLSGNIAGMIGDYAIADNTITGQTGEGVSVATGSPVFDLENNIITGNYYGIELGDSDGPYTFKYNDISGNAWGLFHYSGSNIVITVQYNWWGDISGPSSGSGLTAETYWPGKVSTALGSGDAVCQDVLTWEPWLTRDQATAVSDGIAYHGSIYPLEAGWNTLSVPLALDDAADTLNDIVALGDFIVTSGDDQNYLGGYYYDATNTLWVPLPGAYEFAPCKAVYVKMAADASFPILYSGVFSLPSQSLPAGWNLIGSGFGIDKAISPGGDYGIAATTGDADGTKKVDAALASLGANASVVISPSLPGQTLAWGTVATDKVTDMIVGEGYWVFMTAPATLAGFEVTPIYWITLP